MSTLNLGKIRFNWTGAYNNSTAYVANDVVSSGGNSYICKLASTGNAVSNGTYWDLMSQAGTDGTDLTSTLTTQGDVVYRDGSGLQRLAKPASDKFLKNTSGGVVSWADAGGAWSVKSSGTATTTTAWEVTGLSKTTKCILTDLRTPTNQTLKLRMSSNNGTSYDSGSYDYSYALLYHNDQTTAVANQYSTGGGNDHILMMSQGTAGNGTMRNYLEMTIYDPYIATGRCFVELHCSSFDNANWMFRQAGLGSRKSNDAINAIQLTTSASNMTFNYVVLELN